jgi:hypothetical protein
MGRGCLETIYTAKSQTYAATTWFLEMVFPKVINHEHEIDLSSLTAFPIERLKLESSTVSEEYFAVVMAAGLLVLDHIRGG